MSDRKEIEDIQRLFYDFNVYEGEIDGVFSDETEHATKLFQANYKQYEYSQYHKYSVPLIVDGIVGKETILAMDEAAVNDWKYIKPEEDILYDTKNNCFILLTADMVEEFCEEEKILNDALAILEQTRREESVTKEEALDAKKQTAELVQGIDINSVKTSELTEFRRIKGQKFTYIRSDKMKNHWRSYSLDVDDRERNTKGKEKIDSINEFMTNNQFDKEKIKNAFKSKFNDTKVTFFDWKLLDDSEVVRNAVDWVNTISGNVSTGTQIYDKNGEEMIRNFDAKAEAAWLRFSAGASLKATPTINDILKGKLALSFTADAKYSIAEGNFETNSYIPDSRGWNPTITNYTRSGAKNGQIDMGHLRFIIASQLKGFAGANAILGAEVGFDLDKSKGKLSLATKELIVSTTKMETASAETEIDLFAGIKASCNASGKFEWRSPELGMDFATIAKVSYGGSAAIGAGIEGKFKIDFKEGKFIVRAKAGIVCGAGFSGEVGFEVGADTILNLAEFVYQTLRQMDYIYLDILTNEAFQALTIFTLEVVKRGVEKVEEIYGKLIFTYQEFWSDYFPNLSDEKALAKEIVAKIHDNILKFSTPEAKGSLIAYLSQTSLVRTEETQEMAINHILNFCQSKSEALNVFENVTMDNSKISSDEGKQKILDILDNFSIRTRFVNFGYDGRKIFDNWWKKLPEKPIGKHKKIVAMNDNYYFLDNNSNEGIAYA